MITSNGAFNLAMKVLYKTAVKAMFTLHSVINKAKETSPEILLYLFDKMTVAIVTYSSEIWGAYAFILSNLGAGGRGRNPPEQGTFFNIS